jgi:hypothetical protein
MAVGASTMAVSAGDATRSVTSPLAGEVGRRR